MIETVLSWIDIVAERRIVDAMNEGVFDNPPGKGKPLQLDDDLSVPAHLRIQAKILKNSGGVPEWIQTEKEWLREREYVDVMIQQGLRSLALCGTRDAALRRMIKLYDQTKEQLSLLVNTAQEAQLAFWTSRLRTATSWDELLLDEDQVIS